MSPRGLLVDAGHGLGPSGAADPGATGQGTTEREQVVAIAQALLPLAQTLPVQVFGIGIDKPLSLIDKINQVNSICTQRGWGAEDALLVSIHLNASSDESARGVEAWHGTGKDATLASA